MAILLAMFGNYPNRLSVAKKTFEVNLGLWKTMLAMWGIEKLEKKFGKEHFRNDEPKKPKWQVEEEANAFADSIGMQRWLAKIVFKEQIDLIWEQTEEE